MVTKLRTFHTLTLTATLAALVGCAAVAPQPWDRPVIVNKVGAPGPQSLVDDCIAKAQAAGLRPLIANNDGQTVERNAAYRSMVAKCVTKENYSILGWN